MPIINRFWKLRMSAISIGQYQLIKISAKFHISASLVDTVSLSIGVLLIQSSLFVSISQHVHLCTCVCTCTYMCVCMFIMYEICVCVCVCNCATTTQYLGLLIIGLSPTCNTNVSTPQGSVLGLRIEWNCDLDRNYDNCKPRYSARRLDDRDAQVSPGFNFRYSRNYSIYIATHTPKQVCQYLDD